MPPLTREPARLGPVPDDPATRRADAARAAYQASWQAAVSNHDLTRLAQARLVKQAWETANREIADARTDLETRRRARADWLAAQIPLGPGIPAGTNPADEAVLRTSFRTMLAEASAASPGDLATTLAQAVRYGDDLQLRAILSAADERGLPQLVDQWAGGHPDRVAQLAELRELRGGRDLAGWGVAKFRPIDQPREVFDLPTLEMHAAAGGQRQIGGRR